MRTCDICSTPIPFGTDRCPNCGYRYKPERKLNDHVRAQKKAEYMSQFQPHPSPLDEVKNTFTKMAGVDWSGKIKSVSSLKTKPTVASRNKNKKTIKSIVLAIVISSLIVTLIPIGIGVFIGISNVFDGYVDSDDYSYEWYESFDTLEMKYPEISKEVYPYREYILDQANIYSGNDDIYENYNIYGGQLDYGYLSCLLEVDGLFLDMSVERYTYDDEWTVSYSISDFTDEGQVIKENMLQTLSKVSGESYDEMVSYVKTYFNEFIEDGAYYEYPLDDGWFGIEYSDNYISYSLREPLRLN